MTLTDNSASTPPLAWLRSIIDSWSLRLAITAVLAPGVYCRLMLGETRHAETGQDIPGRLERSELVLSKE
jgi:hypothetical protein